MYVFSFVLGNKLNDSLVLHQKSYRFPLLHFPVCILLSAYIPIKQIILYLYIKVCKYPNYKYHSLGEYQLCIKIATITIFIEHKLIPDDQTGSNFLSS